MTLGSVEIEHGALLPALVGNYLGCVENRKSSKLLGVLMTLFNKTSFNKMAGLFFPSQLLLASARDCIGM